MSKDGLCFTRSEDLINKNSIFETMAGTPIYYRTKNFQINTY